MTSVNDLQELVRQSHDRHFGNTPRAERLRDLRNEVLELVSAPDEGRVKEEVGDAGWSLLQLCNESALDFAACVAATIAKLDGRAHGKKVCLIGTSANPFTNAHLTMGLELRALTDCDEVWYMVSGQHPWAHRNPAKRNMIPAEHRVEMVRRATAPYAPRLKVCDFEVVHRERIFAKPRETAEVLRDFFFPAYPGVRFAWVMGSDVARSFHEWTGWEWMAANMAIYVLHRLGYEWDKAASVLADPKHVYFKDDIATSNISASLVRSRGRDEAKLAALVPEVVRAYLLEHRLLDATPTE